MPLPKLSRTQRELLAALRDGKEVQYAPTFANNPDYFFMRDMGGNCTAAAKALLAKGVVERYEMHRPRFGAFKLRIKDNNLEAVEALLKAQKAGE